MQDTAAFVSNQRVMAVCYGEGGTAAQATHMVMLDARGYPIDVLSLPQLSGRIPRRRRLEDDIYDITQARAPTTACSVPLCASSAPAATSPFTMSTLRSIHARSALPLAPSTCASQHEHCQRRQVGRGREHCCTALSEPRRRQRSIYACCMPHVVARHYQ